MSIRITMIPAVSNVADNRLLMITNRSGELYKKEAPETDASNFEIIKIVRKLLRSRSCSRGIGDA